MRNYFTTLLLLCFALLSGCDDTVDNPTPTPSTRASFESSRYATVKAGAPFEVEGCQIQVHKVFVTRTQQMSADSFTLATAKCPTADVTVTHENCGKNCVHNNILVGVPTAKRDEEAILRQERKTALNKNLEKLRAEQTKTISELKALEQASDK